MKVERGKNKMKSSEFNERKGNIGKYFNNDEKWKENEYGELEYYKGKRNLIELKYVLELVFGDKIEILKEEYLKNNEDKIVGGSITCQIYVDADFNGMNQGTMGADVFITFNLFENSYSYNQSDRLLGLQ
jgi:hypothetical protein